MAYTPDQIEGAKTSYAKTLTIVGLSGAVVGGAMGQGIPQNKTMGNLALGALLGGLGSLLLYGIYLRGGGKDVWRNPMIPEEPAKLAGIAMPYRGGVRIGYRDAMTGWNNMLQGEG